jgi:exodeoxyribonuclease-3
MLIATWNVNSLRARLERVLGWLERTAPDLLCLQETKVSDEEFPRGAFEERGWRVEIFGQRTWNGVAMVSREPVTDVARGFATCPSDTGCRAIGGRFRDLRVLDVYVPNGQEVGSEKYAMKLAWMDALVAWVRESWDVDAPGVICGDFNVAPDDRDVFSPERHQGKILCSEPERERFRALLALGFRDGFRMFSDAPKQYTYWDYGQVMFPRNLGYRLDHVLLTRPAAERCASVTIDRQARTGDRPSDHAPVVAEIRDLA